MASRLRTCVLAFVGSIILGGCSIASVGQGDDPLDDDNAIAALVGTWSAEDGQIRLKVEPDGTAIVQHLESACWTGCAGGLRVEEDEPGLFYFVGQLIEGGGDAGPPMTVLSGVLDGSKLVYTFESRGFSGVIFCSETFELALGGSSDLTCP